MDSEQRKFPRITFRNPVGYRFPDKNVLSGSVAYDLSEGGVRLWVEDFLPLNSEVVVSLQLKPEREVALAARIAWIQKVPHADSFHVGCEFLGNRENTFPKFILKNFLELQAA